MLSFLMLPVVLHCWSCCQTVVIWWSYVQHRLSPQVSQVVQVPWVENFTVSVHSMVVMVGSEVNESNK